MDTAKIRKYCFSSSDGLVPFLLLRPSGSKSPVGVHIVHQWWVWSQGVLSYKGEDPSPAIRASWV